MEKDLLTKIDNKLRDLNIPDLCLNSMNLDRIEKLIQIIEVLEKENNDFKRICKWLRSADSGIYLTDNAIDAIDGLLDK